MARGATEPSAAVAAARIEKRGPCCHRTASILVDCQLPAGDLCDQIASDRILADHLDMESLHRGPALLGGSLKSQDLTWKRRYYGGGKFSLKGGDRVKGYLLLATSCDGTLATTAQFTSVRVVCHNTLQMATTDKQGAIRVPHSTHFDPDVVKRSLGVGMTTWATFQDELQALAARKVNRFDVTRYVMAVLGDNQAPRDQQPNERAIKKVVTLFDNGGLGSTLPSAQGTAWGLVNAVTEYVDHHRRARSQDTRLDSAWFGPGAALKERAFTEALKLVA